MHSPDHMLHRKVKIRDINVKVLTAPQADLAVIREESWAKLTQLVKQVAGSGPTLQLSRCFATASSFQAFIRLTLQQHIQHLQADGNHVHDTSVTCEKTAELT
jgi:hypothetical protein